MKNPPFIMSFIALFQSFLQNSRFQAISFEKLHVLVFSLYPFEMCIESFSVVGYRDGLVSPISSTVNEAPSNTRHKAGHLCLMDTFLVLSIFYRHGTTEILKRM